MYSFLNAVNLEAIIDIAVMSFILYYLLLFVRGTRTQQILFGMLILAIVSVVASFLELELYTLNFAVKKFYSSIIIIFVVLFQDDIRRVLSRMGKAQLFSTTTRSREDVIEEVVNALSVMSKQRIGSLIVIERENSLVKYQETGRPIDSATSADLIRSIFNPSSPLHDGAILIREDRISAASCFLRITNNPEVELNLGTRHRAALGIAEETDALVVVSSEETGDISVVVDGHHLRNLNTEQLEKELTKGLLNKPGSLT